MITELNNKITSTISFIDEAFDKAKAGGYQLVLQIGLDGVQLAVKEIQKNKYIALESYRFVDMYGFDQIVDLWNVLSAESKLVPVRYKAVTCLVVNNISTIVPSPLFEDSKKNMYLKFNTTVHEDDLILVDDIKNLDAKNVFALPQALKTKLASQFVSITYHHCSTVLLESILAQNKNLGVKKLFIHIYPSHFEAVVIEGKNLIFYNTFNFLTSEDFIYYLLFVYEQLQLNPETFEAVFIGEVEKNSELYILAQKYIRNVQMGERTDSTDYSYQLQTLPKHTFFTIFNNHL